MLTNAGIAHKYRITKYPKLNGETPRWQHIYVVVPKDGKLDYDLSNRDDYIVMDCVKHNFDDEQPYLERKDFNMKLDYLNGLDEEEGYVVPEHADAKDMAAIYEEEDLGKIGQWARKAIKTVGKDAGKVAHAVAKVAVSPLRNSLLLAMKENFLNAGKRLRYAYLTDAQAAKLNISIPALNLLRKVKDKIENIYQAAGGEKKNFQAAILKGKGNKDKAVQLAGLNGLGEIYADQDEYNILHDKYPLQGLGDLGILPALAPAVATVTAIAGILSKVKGLFPAGSPAEKDMSNSASPADSGSGNSNDTDTITEDDATTSTDSNSLPSTAVRSPARGNRVPSNAAQTPDNTSLSPAPLTQDTPQTGGVMGFVQANPVVATGIVAAAGITAYYLVKQKSLSRSTSLAGFDRMKKKRVKKVKRSKQQKTFKAVQI